MHRLQTVRLPLVALLLACSITAIALAEAPAQTPAKSAPATKPAGAKHVRLLAIGNSFSGNATKYLRDIVAASGNEITFGHASIGGCSLQKHWTLAQTFEKNPDDAEGKPYSGFRGKGKMSLKEYLQAEKWDIITIQQVSTSSYKAETFGPEAKLLAEYAKKFAPTAQVVMHETWAYRSDDPLFKNGFTSEKMYEGIRDAYAKTAGELGLRVIPVGDAFQIARTDPAWKFTAPDPNFDYAKPEFPKLPDQTHSLNVGYKWANENGKQSLKMDGHHSSPAGEYLGGAVWFEFLFGQDVRGNSFVPKELKAEDVALLQRFAHAAVEHPMCKPQP
jgi:hypothetical protein